MSMNGALFIDDNSSQGSGYADPLTGKLLLAPLLDGLLNDGLISLENHQILTSVRTDAGEANKDALQIIADSGWDNQLEPGRKLTINVLMDWLSTKTGVPVRKIDPLNTDVQAVTSVMSVAYAKRFQIIALEVTPTSVVIGTSEPFDESWQLELSKVLQKDIVKVLLSAADIKRYLHDFIRSRNQYLVPRKIRMHKRLPAVCKISSR